MNYISKETLKLYGHPGLPESGLMNIVKASRNEEEHLADHEIMVNQRDTIYSKSIQELRHKLVAKEDNKHQ